MAETALQQAERCVREAEAKVVRQMQIFAELERDHHPEQADLARQLLATMRELLATARVHLEFERRSAGLNP